MTSAAAEKTVDVIVVGSIYMTTECDEQQWNETVNGVCDRNVYKPGGSGVNQCLEAQKLNCISALIGWVGRDLQGQTCIDVLRAAHKINVECVQLEDGVITGIEASVLKGDGRIEKVRREGANRFMNSACVRAAERLIATSRVLVCQLEISAESSLTALRLAKRHGLTTIFYPCPVVADIPAEMFELTDILCLTCTEMEFLIEKPGYFEEIPPIGPASRRREIADAQSEGRLKKSRLAFEMLQAKYKCNDIIIAFDGKKGAVAWHNESKCVLDHLKKKDKTDFTASSSQEEVTTDKIDTFIGGLAFCISMHLELGIAVRNAVRALIDGYVHFS